MRGLPTFLSLLTLASPALAQVHAQTPGPGWIVDAASGCKAWNAFPEPDESISWSGPCVGGVAEGWGVLQWYRAGQPADRFTGRLQKGKHDGWGIYAFANGDVYAGGWRDGAFHDHGLYIDADGNRYEGEFRNGRAEGMGTRWDADGSVLTGVWTNGCLRHDDEMVSVGWTAWKCGFK